MLSLKISIVMRMRYNKALIFYGGVIDCALVFLSFREEEKLD